VIHDTEQKSFDGKGVLFSGHDGGRVDLQQAAICTSPCKPHQVITDWSRTRSKSYIPIGLQQNSWLLRKRYYHQSLKKQGRLFHPSLSEV
jgi:hypothetical protein